MAANAESMALVDQLPREITAHVLALCSPKQHVPAASASFASHFPQSLCGDASTETDVESERTAKAQLYAIWALSAAKSWFDELLVKHHASTPKPPPTGKSAKYKMGRQWPWPSAHELNTDQYRTRARQLVSPMSLAMRAHFVHGMRSSPSTARQLVPGAAKWLLHPAVLEMLPRGAECKRNLALLDALDALGDAGLDSPSDAHAASQIVLDRLQLPFFYLYASVALGRLVAAVQRLHALYPLLATDARPLEVWARLDISQHRGSRLRLAAAIAASFPESSEEVDVQLIRVTYATWLALVALKEWRVDVVEALEEVKLVSRVSLGPALQVSGVRAWIMHGVGACPAHRFERAHALLQSADLDWSHVPRSHSLFAISNVKPATASRAVGDASAADRWIAVFDAYDFPWLRSADALDWRVIKYAGDYLGYYVVEWALGAAPEVAERIARHAASHCPPQFAEGVRYQLLHCYLVTRQHALLEAAVRNYGDGDECTTLDQLFQNALEVDAHPSLDLSSAELLVFALERGIAPTSLLTNSPRAWSNMRYALDLVLAGHELTRALRPWQLLADILNQSNYVSVHNVAPVLVALLVPGHRPALVDEAQCELARAHMAMAPRTCVAALAEILSVLPSSRKDTLLPLTRTLFGHLAAYVDAGVTKRSRAKADMAWSTDLAWLLGNDLAVVRLRSAFLAALHRRYWETREFTLGEFMLTRMPHLAARWLALGRGGDPPPPPWAWPTLAVGAARAGARVDGFLDGAGLSATFLRSVFTTCVHAKSTAGATALLRMMPTKELTGRGLASHLLRLCKQYLPSLLPKLERIIAAAQEKSY